MATAKKPKVTQQQKYTTIITGLTDSPPETTKVINLEGSSMTVPQVIAWLGTLVQALQASATAKANYAKTVATTNALLAKNKAMIKDVRPALIAAYGSDTAGLAACGFVASNKVRAPRSPEEKTASLAKLRTTLNAKKAALPQGPTITVTDANGQTLNLNGQPVTNAPAVAK